MEHVHRLGRQAPLETATVLRLAARRQREGDLLVVSGGTATERRQALAWALVRGVVAVQVLRHGRGDQDAGDGERPDNQLGGLERGLGLDRVSMLDGAAGVGRVASNMQR